MKTADENRLTHLPVDYNRSPVCIYWIITKQTRSFIWSKLL